MTGLPAERQGAPADKLHVVGANILPLVGLAGSKQGSEQSTLMLEIEKAAMVTGMPLRTYEEARTKKLNCSCSAITSVMASELCCINLQGLI